MKIQCQECKNEKELTQENVQVGWWFECDYCGTTYEVASTRGDGAPELKMVEEEK